MIREFILLISVLFATVVAESSSEEPALLTGKMFGFGTSKSDKEEIATHFPDEAKRFFITFVRGKAKKCNGVRISANIALGPHCEAMQTETPSEIQVVIGHGTSTSQGISASSCVQLTGSTNIYSIHFTPPSSSSSTLELPNIPDDNFAVEYLFHVVVYRSKKDYKKLIYNANYDEHFINAGDVDCALGSLLFHRKHLLGIAVKVNNAIRFANLKSLNAHIRSLQG